MTLWFFILACSTPETEQSAVAASDECASAPPVTWDNWGDGFFSTYCRGCHSSTTTVRNGAPEAFNYDTVDEVIADQAVWAVCGRQGAVLTVEPGDGKQQIVIDVMPLVGGHLPLPAVRLSKYIPAERQGGGVLGGARLEPFLAGQVYNMSRSQQIHVLPALHAGRQPGRGR